ncbi:hypothetical protein [Nonomuraea helvata]|uniref:Uncharacterized protein n=1 Tax=Nonomuraea helvata TaxID=37484 RepID=A0ABV5S1C8_9ACTN
MSSKRTASGVSERSGFGLPPLAVPMRVPCATLPDGETVLTWGRLCRHEAEP